MNLLPSPHRRRRLFQRACAAALGPAAKRPGTLSVVFVTNREIRKINRKHLSHDYNTDVIAFPFAPKGKGKEFLGGASDPEDFPFGDVYVSVDQARIQAREIGHSLLRELLILAIHGTLHLAGYDDHMPADRKRMFARQDRILRQVTSSAP